MKRKNITIWFDMDGTIADLYGVDNWLDYLLKSSTKPYADAKAYVNLSLLSRKLNALQKKGFKIGVISWGCKNASADYDRAVEEVKKVWLKKHMKSVKFDEIKVLHYGTPKHNHKKNGDILFDDELKNREGWGLGAFSEKEIFTVLNTLGEVY